MKCNIPKRKRLKPEEYSRIVDKLTNVNCCKCGRTIEVMSFAYATMHFNRNGMKTGYVMCAKKGGR